jgi:hypothetical protein
MADTESILQLGIEAARAGDKEEARNLFRLLTRETPEDPQSWLWLAGVAEDREEKRAALEQVTRLDPSNELAQQGLAALGGPSKSTVQIPPAPVALAPDTSDADFNDDFNFDFAAEPVESAPPPPAVSTPPPAPAKTRELSPDEEFAMSLDSFGSTSNTYNERAKGGDADFNIPDFGFGDDDGVDLDAYMNRERVDMSQITVSAEEGKAPKRKAITASDEMRNQYKGKTPKAPRDPNAPQRASGGRMPLILMALAVLLVVAALWWFINREPAGVATDLTATPAQAGGVDQIKPTPAGTGATVYPLPGGDVPTAEPGSGGENPLPTLPPTDGSNPTSPPPAGGNFQPDPTLGSVQPAILPGDGSTPINVDNWFFNYGGVSGIADGNAINIQPQGRWVIVGALMFDGTLEGRTLPGDLLVLKDAQGRVYRPNADASEAYLNTYPGSYNINLKQAAPVNQNFSVPLLFDVAPDATDLVLFSPQLTDQGYRVRDNAN